MLTSISPCFADQRHLIGKLSWETAHPDQEDGGAIVFATPSFDVAVI